MRDARAASARAGGNRAESDSRPGLSGVQDEALAAWLVAHGQQAYRARQIHDAVWRQHAQTADQLLTLPAALRASIAEDFRIDTIESDEVTVSDRGLTEKTLHLLSDGAMVESVLMHYPARGFAGPGRTIHRERHTLCISSQAGCAVGCPFCATGELGFSRDLETSEIIDQVRHAAARLAVGGRHLTNVVFMGMGEPLLNLDRVLEAVAVLSDPRRFGLGARHIVVSTSGVVPGIRRLTAMGPQFTLAISLHAARDPLRDVLVPLNRRWPVTEVVAAARDHARVTGRRISYEYVMISGVNDTDVDADALADLLRGDLAHVNLIPMNPVAHTPWQASSAERVAELLGAGPAGRHRRDRSSKSRSGCGSGLRPACRRQGRGALGSGRRASPRGRSCEPATAALEGRPRILERAHRASRAGRSAKEVKL